MSKRNDGTGIIHPWPGQREHEHGCEPEHEPDPDPGHEPDREPEPGPRIEPGPEPEHEPGHEPPKDPPADLSTEHFVPPDWPYPLRKAASPADREPEHEPQHKPEPEPGHEPVLVSGPASPRIWRPLPDHTRPGPSFCRKTSRSPRFPTTT